MVGERKMVDCRKKDNKNKFSCKLKTNGNTCIKRGEYAKREIAENYVYIPIFIIFVFALSYFGFVRQEDKITLIWFLVIGAISGTISFLLTKRVFSR